MAVPPNRTIVCPRCSAPVTGDFKFCPTCAYRLRPGEPVPAAAKSARRRWPHVLVGVLLGGLVVAISVVGFRLFAPPLSPPGDVGSPPAPGVVLTVREHLLSLMVNLQPAVCLYWPDPEESDPGDGTLPEDLPVYVPWPSKILRYEVTRGMYAEFVASCEADPERVPALLRSVWSPVPTGNEASDAVRQGYSGEYVDHWWDRAAHSLERATGRPVARPPDLIAPLPAHYGVLLLVPPEWVYQSGDEEFRWRVPEGTENLPVTEVSWYDAVGFAEWASAELSVELRLPLYVEWIRAGNGGAAGRRYPWGDVAYRYACNSLNFWGEEALPRLLAVDYRYSDADGRTPEGIWGVAGNAREWTYNNVIVKVGNHLEPRPEPAEAETRRARAPTLGGSFREGVQDCTVDVDSLQMLDKHGRYDHVGFRLWMAGTWMGG